MKRILIVDDDEIICFLLKEFLNKNDFQVIVMNDGERVIKCIEEEKPNLLITDLVMPNVEGIELISQIRESDEKLPIIAISSGGKFNSSIFLDVAQTIGANAILKKPFKKEKLLNIVNSLIN